MEQIGWLLHLRSLQLTGIISSLIMPVDSLYRKIVCVLLASTAANPVQAMSQMGPFGARAEPSVWMLVYTMVYLLGALALAVRVFSRRDI